jgi:hypothetical protein
LKGYTGRLNSDKIEEEQKRNMLLGPKINDDETKKIKLLGGSNNSIK